MWVYSILVYRSTDIITISPNHLRLASLALSYALRPSDGHMILSILVSPKEKLHILTSATSSSTSCLFLTASISEPYNISASTIIFYTFPFILADAPS